MMVSLSQFRLLIATGLVCLCFLLSKNGFAFEPDGGADRTVWAIAYQPNQKILIAGDFTKVNGVARSRIARLNRDGSLDASFDPQQGPDNRILAMALQPDGKILIGGQFNNVESVSRGGVARLNSDGSLDTSFNPGSGTDGRVFALAQLPNGKVYIAGEFTQVSGSSRSNIARLNSDGSLDSGHSFGSGVNAFVNSLALQPDGKLLASGGFTIARGNSRNYIVRFDTDGSVDQSFATGSGANNFVRTLVLQSDGKILLAGDFTTLRGNARNSIARMNPDSSVDQSFDAGDSIVGTLVWKMVLQPDGKVLVGGRFSSPLNNVARFNADGSIDQTFNTGTGFGREVRALVLQPNGKVLVGGVFENVNEVSRNRIARLNSDGSLDVGGDEEAICIPIKAANQKLAVICL